MSFLESCDSLLAGQEVRLLLWKPNVHYHVQRNQPLDPTMSHLDRVCTHIIFLIPLYCNSLSRFPWRFRTEMYVFVITRACYMPRPARLIFLDFIYRSSVTLYSSDFIDFSSSYTVPLTRHTVVLVDCICSGLCPYLEDKRRKVGRLGDDALNQLPVPAGCEYNISFVL